MGCGGLVKARHDTQLNQANPVGDEPALIGLDERAGPVVARFGLPIREGGELVPTCDLVVEPLVVRVLQTVDVVVAGEVLPLVRRIRRIAGVLVADNSENSACSSCSNG